MELFKKVSSLFTKWAKSQINELLEKSLIRLKKLKGNLRNRSNNLLPMIMHNQHFPDLHSTRGAVDGTKVQFVRNIIKKI